MRIYISNLEKIDSVQVLLVLEVAGVFGNLKRNSLRVLPFRD